MEHQGNFVRVKFNNRTYWRRGDGCWFYFGSSLLKEVKHSTHRELENAWIEKSLSTNSEADSWKKKYEELLQQIDWESKAKQQQVNLMGHRDLKPAKTTFQKDSYDIYAGVDFADGNDLADSLRYSLEAQAYKAGRTQAQFQDDIAYGLLPEELKYDRDGDMDDETVIAAQKWLREQNPEFIYALSHHGVDGPFQLMLNGELKGEGFMGRKENVYVCEFFPTTVRSSQLSDWEAEQEKQKQFEKSVEGAYRRGFSHGAHYVCEKAPTAMLLGSNFDRWLSAVVGWRADSNQGPDHPHVEDFEETEVAGQQYSKPQDGYYIVKLDGHGANHFECNVVRGELGYCVTVGTQLNMNTIWPLLAKFEGDWEPARMVTRQWYETSSPYFPEAATKRRYEVGNMAVEETYGISESRPEWQCQMCGEVVTDVSDITADSRCRDCAEDEFVSVEEATRTDNCRIPEKEPTRPSEDDMMYVGNPSGPSWVKDRFLKGDAPNYNRFPQWRDIGIRIDRYGSLVFKPELVKKE